MQRRKRPRRKKTERRGFSTVHIIIVSTMRRACALVVITRHSEEIHPSYATTFPRTISRTAYAIIVTNNHKTDIFTLNIEKIKRLVAG